MQPSGRAFSFIQTNNPEALNAAIVMINRRRRIPIYYQRIIQTAPRRGWSALIFDGALIDHYLLRNLSGRLSTKAFGISTYNMQLSYRFHVQGQTQSAYESHLALMITDRVRRLLATGAIQELDLSEPAERLILQRYHAYQHNSAWTQPSARDEIPADIALYYTGNVTRIAELLKPGIDPRYVAEVLEPGFSSQTALQRLLESLVLPYLVGDEVTLLLETTEQSPVPQRIDGTAILHPQQWTTIPVLPKNWGVVTAENWA